MMRRIGAWVLLALFAVLLANLLFFRVYAMESALLYMGAVAVFVMVGGLRKPLPEHVDGSEAEPTSESTTMSLSAADHTGNRQAEADAVGMKAEPDAGGSTSDDSPAEGTSQGETPPHMESAEDVAAHVAEDLERVRVRKRRMRVASNLMILAGAALIIVPLALTWISRSRNDSAVDEFLAEAAVAADDAAETAEQDSGNFYEGSVNFSEELTPPGALSSESTTGSESTASATVAESFGSSDSSETTVSSETPSSTKKPLMSKEEIRKRMIGVLVIKKIDVKLPILDGVDDETLRVAAGRMPESGKLDEIGNVVLAGHRSYTFGKYFNRLDEMEIGDEITVTTKSKTLKYVVYNKIVVEPNDFSIMNYNDTDKILTLFTCHPVVIASHRLVVQAKQVE